jgi:hypothetical protein
MIVTVLGTARRFDVRVGLLGAGGPLALDDSGVLTVSMGGGGKVLLLVVMVVLMVVDRDRAENAEIASWTWGR